MNTKLARSIIALTLGVISAAFVGTSAQASIKTAPFLASSHTAFAETQTSHSPRVPPRPQKPGRKGVTR